MKNYPLSQKVQHLEQSGIRAASTRCSEIKGINLGQGVCDIPTQDAIKHAANEAINHNHNTYSAHQGVAKLRQKVAQKLYQFNQIKADPKTEINITHGSTGAYISAVQTLFNPGDEVILFEPFYSYHNSILDLFGITTKTVSINLTDLSIDLAELKQAITAKTRGIVVCTPNNPTGKVFTKAELCAIGDLAKQHNLFIITDEIYEYITYPEFKHVSMASLNDYSERTITISGFSKTYNITGWRLGYAAAPAHITEKMALVHDLFYVCPATPLQYAAMSALDLPTHYYEKMQHSFLERRDYMVKCLKNFGFQVTIPQGAYYIMADFTELSFNNDIEITQQLLEHAKVATVTGHSFYQSPKKGTKKIRFCYALNDDKIKQAMEQFSHYFNAK